MEKFDLPPFFLDRAVYTEHVGIELSKGEIS